MMQIRKIAGIFALCLVVAMSMGAGTVEAVKRHGYTEEMVKLKQEMRRLWIEHLFWTRNYVVSAVAGLDDKQPMLARLLRNQDEIGNTVKPYYGDAAGNQLAALLREHILIAGKIVDAAKAGNQAEVKRLDVIWHKNADEISRYLNKLNPLLPEQTMREIYYRHLDLVAQNLNARLTKNWEADIRAADAGEAHLILFADILSEGIIKQFPKKFKR